MHRVKLVRFGFLQLTYSVQISPPSAELNYWNIPGLANNIKHQKKKGKYIYIYIYQIYIYIYTYINKFNNEAFKNLLYFHFLQNFYGLTMTAKV